jgi:hypothetical protein
LNNVEEISNRLELVPLLGRIQISHDLVCLKNGRTYDSGSVDYYEAKPPDRQILVLLENSESLYQQRQRVHAGG